MWGNDKDLAAQMREMAAQSRKLVKETRVSKEKVDLRALCADVIKTQQLAWQLKSSTDELMMAYSKAPQLAKALLLALDALDKIKDLSGDATRGGSRSWQEIAEFYLDQFWSAKTIAGRAFDAGGEA